jgi:hypothetical protein
MKSLLISIVGILFIREAVGQHPQIPTLQVCNANLVAAGTGRTRITGQISGAPTPRSGDVSIAMNTRCEPTAEAGYPTGLIEMNFSLHNSSISRLKTTSIEQMMTTGKDTPIAVLSARCITDNNRRCHLWLMVVDNKRPGFQGTPDSMSFIVLDTTGRRIAHGMAPLTQGDFTVDANH